MEVSPRAVMVTITSMRYNLEVRATPFGGSLKQNRRKMACCLGWGDDRESMPQCTLHGTQTWSAVCTHVGIAVGDRTNKACSRAGTCFCVNACSASLMPTLSCESRGRASGEQKKNENKKKTSLPEKESPHTVGARACAGFGRSEKERCLRWGREEMS